MNRILLALLCLATAAAPAADAVVGLGAVPTNTTLTAPGPIGTGTPSSGAFTTLSSSGLATLNSGSVTTTLGVTGLATLTAGLTTPAAITSTLATGTAPFTVASTTVVGNLNVSQLLGSTWASPAAIGTGTPLAGTFTTLTGNTNVISGGDFLTASKFRANSTQGDTGSVYITGSNTTNGTNANITLYAKSHASQANRIFYDSARHALRAADGSVDYIVADGTNVTLGLPVLATSTTDSSSAATGALIVSGGGAFAKNIVGGAGLGVGLTSTVSAAGTTVLTAASKVVQVTTGSTTQTYTLPAANALGAGVSQVLWFKNVSSGTVTIQRAGSDTINTTASNTSFTVLTFTSAILVSDGVSAWEKL